MKKCLAVNIFTTKNKSQKIALILSPYFLRFLVVVELLLHE